MKVAFFSNYLSIHQLPFCEEMNRIADFTFVATTPFNQERLKHGYTDLNTKYPFVLNAYKNSEEENKALKLALEADILILGHAPYRYARKRLRLNKITFLYSERPRKEDDNWIKEILRTLKYRAKYSKKKPLYMLCAGSYTASDYARYGVFRGKCYKWGYFPELIQYGKEASILENKEDNSIIWVARMLEWKHPEVCIYLADRLRNAGYSFHINMIGNGPVFEKTESLIKDLQLESYITLQGTLPSNEVRAQMEKAKVFLLTSDKNEGWGAVLNESMNSYCIPVSSVEAGATAFLIKDKENGYIYDNKNQNKLFHIIKGILYQSEDVYTVAKNAYTTITDMWNAENAAERLLILSEKLKNGEESPFSDGPCSKCE